MVRPKRSQQTDLARRIREAAWEQIAEEGAPALSLRGIARALNITAPAIYNHYASRDELVTALIVEAFSSFGAFLAQSLDGIPQDAHPERLMSLGLAYRERAMQYPERYQLIFGTPIPGYHAPVGITTPAAVQGMQVLTDVLDGIYRAGQMRPLGLEIPPALQSQLETWRGMHPVADIQVLYLAQTIATRVHGMVMMEIGRQYPLVIQSPEALYRCELENIQREVFGGGPGG